MCVWDGMSWMLSCSTHDVERIHLAQPPFFFSLRDTWSYLYPFFFWLHTTGRRHVGVLLIPPPPAPHRSLILLLPAGAANGGLGYIRMDGYLFLSSTGFSRLSNGHLEASDYQGFADITEGGGLAGWPGGYWPCEGGMVPGPSGFCGN